MTVAGLTPRLREEGRLRMGDSEPIPGKKHRRAVKLTEWRLTSPNRDAIETAAKLWGGEAHEWERAPGEQQQWEVHTDASELNVLVPFPQALEERQLYELYTAGGRTRACNGQEEFISGGPCLCEADKRECKLTTHLLVVLPELPGIGVWRLTTSGYNAAVELAGAMRILRSIHARSHFATAALVLEQRQQKVPGQAERQFVVPVLRLPYSLAEAGLGGHLPPALPAGVDPETGEIVSTAVGYETVSGSAPRSVNPSEQGHTVSAPRGGVGGEDGSHRSPDMEGLRVGADTTSAEAAHTLPSTEGASPNEERGGEELRDTEADHSAAKTPDVTPSRRPCLHLNGTRSHERESDGARVEVCVDCGAVIEMIRNPA
jgi:hypothetical protein